MEAMEVTKELLESFSKTVLLGLFPSLEIKKSENKGFVVESIITGSPTDDEKEAFKTSVTERDEENSQPEEGEHFSKVTKSDLNQFTKRELKGFFGSSVDIVVDDPKIKKGDIIDDIMSADLEDSEVDEFKKHVIKIDKNAEYITEHNIKEDGKVFKKGKKYTGENAGRMLKNGQIRKRDR